MVLKKGFTLILELVLTRIAVPQHTNATECIANTIQSFTSPTLIAVSKDQEPLLFSVSHFMSNLDMTYYVINETYNFHFSESNIHVDSGVVLAECQQDIVQLLSAIKNNRLISVEMKLVVFVDVRCQNNLHEEVVINLFTEIRQILNPALAGVYAFHDSKHYVYLCDVYGLIKSFKDKNSCRINKSQNEIFQRYPLKIVTALQDPYVLSPTDGYEYEEGLEIKIIRTIAEKMENDLIWVTWPDGENPRLLQNGKGEFAGIMGVLHRLEADIGFAGILPQLGRAAVSEMLPSHTEDALQWLIPAAPVVQNLGAIFSVFSLTTWLLVVSVFVIFSVYSCLVRCYTSDSLSTGYSLYISLTETWAVLLDQSIQTRSYHVIFSLLLLLYVLYCLIITSAYRSSLVTVLTAEFEGKWYETPEEVVAAGETSYFYPSGRELYEKTAEYDPMWQTILTPGRFKYIENFEILNEIAKTRHGMALCITNPCKSSVFRDLMGSDMKPKVIILKKIFNRFPVTMFMAPGCPLYPALLKRTLWLLQGGLTVHWLEEIFHLVQLKSAYDETRIVDVAADDGPTKLTVGHLKPVFLLLLLFLTLSLGSFIFEMLYSK